MRKLLGVAFCSLVAGATLVAEGSASADAPRYKVQLLRTGYTAGAATIDVEGLPPVEVLSRRVMRAMTLIDGVAAAGQWVEFYDFAKDTRFGPENAFGGPAYRGEGHFRLICSAASGSDGIAQCVDESGIADDYNDAGKIRAEAEWEKGKLDRDVQCAVQRSIHFQPTCWQWDDTWTRASFQVSDVEVAKDDRQYWR